MARFAIALLALWGCKADDRVTTPITNVAAPAPAPSPIPAGWVTIQPSAERLDCALHAHDDWRVEIEQGAVKLTKATSMEQITGPPLPFPIPWNVAMGGSRHVLAVDGGFLVGFDDWEFGGALHWFAADGSGHQKLAGENVVGLVALGPDAAVAIEGLAHLDVSEGRMRWLERRGDAFAVAGVTKLPDAARAGAAVGDTIYVLTTSRLVRIGRDRRSRSCSRWRRRGSSPTAWRSIPAARCGSACASSSCGSRPRAAASPRPGSSARAAAAPSSSIWTASAAATDRPVYGQAAFSSSYR